MVGAGYFGQLHGDAWSRTETANLVAICDADLSKAEALARQLGADGPPVPVFGSVAEMVKTLPVDLVDIITPPGTHNDLIEQLAPHVGYIICQKPFCGGVAGAKTAIETCERHDTRLAVHENVRFQPWYRHARRLIDAETLGEIYQITFRLRPGDGQGPNVYLDRQPYFQNMERLLVHETAIHWIDTFRYLAGEIRSVSASLNHLNPAIAGEDAGIILFQMEGGRRALFDGNRLADHAAQNRRLTMGEMLIEGSAGTLRLDGDGRLWLRAFGSNDEAEQIFDWRDHLFGGDCVYQCAAHIVRAWQAGGEPETAATLYVRNQMIEEAIYESAASGRQITV